MPRIDNKNTERGIAVLEVAMLVSLLSLASITAIAASGIAITSTFDHATASLCEDELAAVASSNICHNQSEGPGLVYGDGGEKPGPRLN